MLPRQFLQQAAGDLSYICTLSKATLFIYVYIYQSICYNVTHKNSKIRAIDSERIYKSRFFN